MGFIVQIDLCSQFSFDIQIFFWGTRMTRIYKR